MVIDGVRVRDEIAGVAGEQRVDRVAVVPVRELVEHVLVRRDHHPEVAVPASLGRLHEHAGGVDAEVGRALGVGEHRVDERGGQLTQLVVPRAERALGQSEPLAGRRSLRGG